MTPSLRLLSALLLSCSIHAHSRANLLDNPEMTEGEDTPLAWTERWVGSGAVVGARDIDVYRSAPASLRASATGSAKGQIGQSVPVSPGQRYQVGAWLKSDPGIRAQVGVTYKNADSQPIGYEQIRYNATAADWAYARRVVTIPDQAVTAMVILMVEGEGQAWMDDVTLDQASSLTETNPAPTSKPSTPNLPGAAASSVLVRDFATGGLDYGYEGWATLTDIVQKSPTGVVLRGPAKGGAGFVLEKSIQKRAATHLQLTLVVGARNTMTQLKLVIPDPVRIELPIELGLYPSDMPREVRLPLPSTAPAEFSHLQVQGNFAADERVEVELRNIALLTL
jgi:hypothetical protein